MHYMRTIALDSLSVCQSVTRLRCAKTAERIEVSFGAETLQGPGHSVLDGGSDPQWQ